MEFPLGLSGSRSHLSSCLQPLLEREISLGSLEGLWSQTLQTGGFKAWVEQGEALV